MKPQSPQRNPLCAPKESPPYPPLSPCVEAVSQGRKRAVIPAKLVPAKAGSGNPGYLKEARLPESTRYFSWKGPAWMDAYAGMTNYDPVSWGRGMEGGGNRWVGYEFQCSSVKGRDQEVNNSEGTEGRERQFS